MILSSLANVHHHQRESPTGPMRCRRPLADISSCSNWLDATPEKSRHLSPHCSGGGANLDPLTPTTNLKLLIRVASEVSEAANKCCNTKSPRSFCQRQSPQTSLSCARRRRRIIFSDSEHRRSIGEIDHDYFYHNQKSLSNPTTANSLLKPSRKEKSLGLLCKKFISHFPTTVTDVESCEVPLDDIARTMNTERRRIYDIVNVLEAIQMMTKVGKSLYHWHGMRHQSVTLAWLFELGQRLHIADRLKETQLLMQRYNGPTDSSLSAPCSSPISPVERKTSLGVACQKFLMLYLVAPDPKIISLEFAARVIHGVTLSDAVLKTRVRRLYDIANILQSLNLIAKVQLTDSNGKSGFQYVGPKVGKIELKRDVLHSLPSIRQRHSLLTTVGRNLKDLPDEDEVTPFPAAKMPRKSNIENSIKHMPPNSSNDIHLKYVGIEDDVRLKNANTMKRLTWHKPGCNTGENILDLSVNH